MLTLKDFQIKFRAHQATLDYELYYDVNLPEISAQNIATLKNHLIKNFPGQPPIDEPRMVNGLTQQEVAFVCFVRNHLSFTHSTKALSEIQANDHTMESLQVRMRKQQQITNRVTRAGSRTDNYLFFSLGQQVPSFLPQGQHKITIDPLRLNNENALVFHNAFISWYPRGDNKRKTSHPVLLGDCKFYFTHVSDNEKHYVYQQKDKPAVKWAVTFTQEIFFGRDILWGLAYQMVLHLRLIGGAYRQHVLTTFVDDKIDLEKKCEVFEALQSILMLADSYPELKVPVKFKVTAPGVNVIEAKRKNDQLARSFADEYQQRTHQAQLQGELNLFSMNEKTYQQKQARNDYERKLLLVEAVKRGDLNFLEYWLSINTFDLNEAYTNNGLLHIAITHIHDQSVCIAVLKLLIQKGADPNILFDDEKSIYYVAVEKEKILVFEYLLTLTYPHPLDAHVRQLPHLNSDNRRILGFLNATLLDLICENGRVDFLMLAVAHGANIHQNPCGLYLKAAEGEHLAIIKQLHALGANLQEVPAGYKTPLMVFAKNGCVEGIELLLSLGACPHYRFQGNENHGFTALDFAIENEQQDVIDVLKKQGVEKKATPENAAEFKHVSCVVVVTVTDPSTQKTKVLMGIKRYRDNTCDDKYRFPGGFFDIKDEDFIATAKRELKEETSLDLNARKFHGLYTTHTLATFSKVYENTAYQIHFIHFHLLLDPKKIRLKADDDLAMIAWIDCENIRVGYDKYNNKHYFAKANETYTSIEKSNGIVLFGLLYGGLEKATLDEALSIAHFGTKRLLEETRKDNVVGIQYLVANGVDYNAHIPDFLTVLGLAAASGSRDAVHYYLQLNPDLKKVTPQPAVFAALADHWAIFDLLHEVHSLDPDSQFLILKHCILTQNTQRLSKCLESFTVDLNHRPKGGQYLLTVAAQIGNTTGVDLLMANGAKINPEFIGVADDMTKVQAPLHAALEKKQQAMAIYLIQKGADFNVRDHVTHQALMKASYATFFNVAQSVYSADYSWSNVEKKPAIEVLSMFNYDTNGVMKALIYECGQVVSYLVKINAAIDNQQLDLDRLQRYKPYYPQLIELVAGTRPLKLT